MKIAISASLDFSYEIKKIADKLLEKNHKVIIPLTAEKILNDELTLEEIKKEKENGKISKRAIKYNVLKYYFKKIKESDSVLVLNLDKKGIKNYIGGSVLLEMGFAHILDKKIFLLNPIPDMIYKDEIITMQPVILFGDLNKIR